MQDQEGKMVEGRKPWDKEGSSWEGHEKIQ